MTWLLDTNVWIEVLRGRRPQLRDKLGKIDPAEVVLSAVVFGELMVGAIRSESELAQEAIEAMAQSMSVLPFDENCARTWARIEVSLGKRGLRIGSRDGQIAATALFNGLILVTHNTSEFSRIDGLKIEDWQAAE